MIDPRFFHRGSPLTLEHVLGLTEAVLATETDLRQLVHDVATLDEATPESITCLHNAKYCRALLASQAGFCFVSPDHAKDVPKTTLALITPTPYRAFALVTQCLYPDAHKNYEVGEGSIHPSAVLGDGCVIEPGAIIQRDAILGQNVCVGANAVIGKGVVIGDGCVIEAGASLSYCLIGKDCVVGPGVRIGQPGFGFFMDERGHVTVPQLGRVLIGNGVEIGANTTIDRGSLKDTILGDGCRLDNLVQIAHNVKLGRGCVIVSQVGVAGSSELGDYVIVAGQVGIAGHIKIGNRARIAAQSGIMRDVLDGETVAGTPAVPVKQWHRQTVALGQLTKKRKI